jgi:hypothetical protein
LEKPPCCYSSISTSRLRGSGDHVNGKTTLVIGILFTEFLDDHEYLVVMGVLEWWSTGVMLRFIWIV